jgi:anaerobic selenocysteine-containing dehydrogenase
MFRRNFIQLVTLAGAGSLSAIGAFAAESKTVTYRIQGFSCVTCAVGLDVMLEQQKGVVRAKSSYNDARTTIVFHPELVTESALRAFIAEMGFVPGKEEQ